MDVGDDNGRVRRCLDGDPGAFEELVVAYQGVLFHLALRMTGNQEDARDLTQNVFLKAYRALSSFDYQHRFYSWIYRIMMNEALNFLDRRKPQSELDEQLPDRSMGPEDRAHRGAIEDVVQDAIMTLPPGDRQVLALRHFQDLSYLEMADVLGVPEKTVKSRLYSARQRLGDELRRRGITEA